MDLKISDKASQLAKEWVKNMKGGEISDSEEADSSELKTDGRPARLGLGAEYVPHSSRLVSTIHPVEKKLRAKLNVSKGALPDQVKLRKAGQAAYKPDLEKCRNEEEGDDEAGRGSFFSRKQMKNALEAHLLAPGKGNKKRKKS